METLFGTIRLRRNYHHHLKSGAGRCPLDERLGLEGFHTPAVARLMCRAASRSGSYREATLDLAAYAGLNFDPRDLGRLVGAVAAGLGEALAELPPATSACPVPVLYASCDGTGTPMRREELRGVKGKSEDGTARTREAKLGCVFTQTSCDDHGSPMRDPDSTSYVATYQGCREIAVLLHQEARRRGLDRAGQVVFIGDGAAWVWENRRRREAVEVEISDLESHATRTRYGEYRANGWFIGSGVIEAGCKTVVGRRLKQSGMFWSEAGAENMLGLRCLVLGPHFDDAWRERRNLVARQKARERRWSVHPESRAA